MNEVELNLLFDLKEEYYIELSKLIASIVEKSPEKLQPYLLMMLQDSSSVYNSAYRNYLSKELKGKLL